MFLLFVSALHADDTSSVDLFAGWSWMPFPYSAYPYYDWNYPGWPMRPYTGVLVPLDRRDAAACRYPCPYGVAGYDPYWWPGYTVHVRLFDPCTFPALSTGLLPPMPGTAPLAPHNRERESQWDRDIQPFLQAITPEWWCGQTSATNAFSAK